MPTYERAAEFKRDWKRLDDVAKEGFKSAVREFREDLQRIESGSGDGIRGSLRVKPMKSVQGVWELTWEGNDGRATFDFGPAITPGKLHIRWRRIGNHGIFTSP